MKPGIAIKVVVAGHENIISTYRNEYRSLMALIKDQLYPDGFGDCGGMGRCATCQIKLTGSDGMFSMERNEQSTLNRLGILDPAIRLSCQILLEPALENNIITVLE